MKAAALLLLAVLGGGGLWGLGKQEPPSGAPFPAGEPLPAAEPEPLPAGELTLTGRVRLVGSAAFPRMVLTDGEGRDWYMDGPGRELLARYEQRQVTVRGRAEYQDLILANGQKAGVERRLRELALLSSGEEPEGPGP